MNDTPLPTRLIAPGALFSLPALLMQHGFGARVLVVADANTHAAAGNIAMEALAANSYQPTLLAFKAGAEASMANALRIVERAEGMQGLVAVGSGTVNDLTKYAAHRAGLPYLLVATAASMNGYTSATASLKAEGAKHSYAATPPKAVLADLNVIAAAPPRLAQAGIGDSFCRSTVEADMLLAHHLFGTDYPKAFFDTLRAHEAVLLGMAEELRAGKKEALEALMEVLLDSGDAMAAYGSSATASQGEHMIAHLLDLRHAVSYARYHGEQIAVTTLTMAELQERLIGDEAAQVQNAIEFASFRDLFGEMAEEFYTLYAKKRVAAADVPALEARLRAVWPELGAAIRAVMLPSSRLREYFAAVGLPTEPEQLGVEAADYEAAVRAAYLTRDRFTFLDLAAMADF